MTLTNPRQLEATREKLGLLERKISEIRERTSGARHSEELTLRSLKRLANQLKEEIVRCEATSLSANDTSDSS